MKQNYKKLEPFLKLGKVLVLNDREMSDSHVTMSQGDSLKRKRSRTNGFFFFFF